MRGILIAFLLLFVFGLSFSQKNQIKISGILKDSLRNDVLRAASVSLYSGKQTSVDQVTLTDGYGTFSINYKKVDSLISLSFNYQGYHSKNMKVKINDKTNIDLGVIHLNQNVGKIDTIELFGPVRMNKDTIEFNTDFFKLDSNAVVEDLLYKLPGMVIWGDGKITYKGKPVPKVLVNGKEFFGDDKGIALKNIPKNSIDKVQVYEKKTSSGEENQNGEFEMNLVLKEGKDKMIFGSITLGMGTKKRQDGNINLNFRDNLNEASILFARNNINKELLTFDQLLLNSSFKGIGVLADYNPDFFKLGEHSEDVYGLRYSRDFVPIPDGIKRSRLTTSVMINFNRDAVRDSSSTTYLGTGEHQNFSELDSERSKKSKKITGDLTYVYANKVKDRSVELLAFFSGHNSTEKIEEQNSNKYDYLNNNSLNNFSSFLETNNKLLTSNISFTVDQKISTNRSSLIDRMSLDNKLNLEVYDRNGINEISNDYIDYISEDESRLIERRYENLTSGIKLNNSFQVSIPQLNLFYSFALNNTNSDIWVWNGTSFELPNEEQTRNENLLKANHQFGLRYFRTLYSRNNYGRFEKNLNLNLSLAKRFQFEKNQSNLFFRNLDRDLPTLLPYASLNYKFERKASYQFNSQIEMKYDEFLAGINQLAPIYDDINPTIRWIPNIGLKPYSLFNLVWSNSYTPRNSINATINLKVGYDRFKNEFIDSIVFNDNQTQYHLINSPNPGQNLFFNFDFKKAYIFKNRDNINFDLSININRRLRNMYSNSFLYHIERYGYDLSFNSYYTKLDRFQLGWKNYINLSNVTRNLDREDISNKYKSMNWNSSLVLAYLITKKLTINNNLSNRFFDYGKAQNLLIWNLGTSYRLGRGNDYEVKATFYDLLKQNKGIYIRNDLDSSTIGYRNVLSPFVMVSLSYFPRKF